jgi:hypothetical protein
MNCCAKSVQPVLGAQRADFLCSNETKRCIRCRIICWTLNGVRRQSSGVISGLGQVCGSESINLRLPNQMELFTVFFLPPVNGYNKINILLRPEKKEVRGRKTVQTRPLGKADLHLTTIGLGTCAIGGPWDFGWGPQEDTESIAAIQQALAGY